MYVRNTASHPAPPGRGPDAATCPASARRHDARRSHDDHASLSAPRTRRTAPAPHAPRSRRARRCSPPSRSPSPPPSSALGAVGAAGRLDAAPTSSLRVRHRRRRASRSGSSPSRSPRTPTRATSSPTSSTLNQLDSGDVQPGQRLAIPRSTTALVAPRPPERAWPSPALLESPGGHASPTSPSATTCAGRRPYGAPQKHVRFALNVNENTHPIPEDVARDIVESLARAVLTRQPLPRPRVHRAARVPRRLPRPRASRAEQIWAANGSNEVIQQLLQAFGGPGRSVLGFPPTYSMHSIIAAGTGTRWIDRRARRRLRDLARDRRRGDRARSSPTSSSSARRTTPRARRCRSRRSRRPTTRPTASSSSTRRTPSSCRTDAAERAHPAARAASASSSPAR